MGRWDDNEEGQRDHYYIAGAVSPSTRMPAWSPRRCGCAHWRRGRHSEGVRKHGGGGEGRRGGRASANHSVAARSSSDQKNHVVGDDAGGGALHDCYAFICCSHNTVSDTPTRLSSVPLPPPHPPAILQPVTHIILARVAAPLALPLPARATTPRHTNHRPFTHRPAVVTVHNGRTPRHNSHLVHSQGVQDSLFLDACHLTLPQNLRPSRRHPPAT